MKHGLLICITGIDGAGKSTLAKHVSQQLTENGYNACYIYGRVVPLASRFVMWVGRMLLLRRKKSEIFTDYDNYVGQKRNLYRNKLVSNVFTWTILLDQIVQANLKIRLAKIKRDIVICDRYYIDAIITDIACDLELCEEYINAIIRFVERLVPRVSQTYLIDIPTDIAFARKHDVPDIDYLEERRNLYLKVFKNRVCTFLDGRQTISELGDHILYDMRDK